MQVEKKGVSKKKTDEMINTQTWNEHEEEVRLFGFLRGHRNLRWGRDVPQHVIDHYGTKTPQNSARLTSPFVLGVWFLGSGLVRVAQRVCYCWL